MTSSSTSSRDTAIVIGGLLTALVIGGGWIYRNIIANSKEEVSLSKAAPSYEFTYISSDDLRKVLFSEVIENGSERKKIRIVDARPGSLWSEGHVIGSESLMPEDAARSFEPNSDDMLVNWIVLGDTQERARALANVLVDRGIPINRIQLFDGTFSTWKVETGLVTSPGNPSSPEDVVKVRLLSPREASALLQDGSVRKVVDVRSSQEFSLGHIPKAINIPFSDLEHRRNELSLASGMLVYGGTDIESFRAGTLLFDLGIFSVTSLSGSFDDWKNADLPVEK